MRIFLNSQPNFRNQSKTITECTSSNSTKLNDITVLNLALCSDVQVKKEVDKVPDAPQSLNLQRVSCGKTFAATKKIGLPYKIFN